MQYKVTKQTDGQMTMPFAAFTYMHDAKLFIQAKLTEDRGQGLAVMYFIFDENNLVEPIYQASTGIGERQSEDNKVTFRPTPFNMSPLPSGYPHEWLIDKETSDKKK